MCSGGASCGSKPLPVWSGSHSFTCTCLYGVQELSFEARDVVTVLAAKVRHACVCVCVCVSLNAVAKPFATFGELNMYTKTSEETSVLKCLLLTAPQLQGDSCYQCALSDGTIGVVHTSKLLKRTEVPLLPMP